MTKNDIITLRIDGYSYSGDGVAHHNGRAVFVRRALLGELLTARILKVTKTAVFAKIETLLEPSSERTAPECVHFGKCGGCSLMHMSYREELRYKHSRVSDALRHIGGVDINLPPVDASPEVLRYRNKAIFEVGIKGDSPVTGFFRERSHDIVPVSDCLIQSHTANRTAKAVEAWMAMSEIPYGLIRYVFCRTASNGRVQIVIVSRHKKLLREQTLVNMLLKAVPEICGILHCVNNTPGNIVLTDDMRTLYGEALLSDTLCGYEYYLSPQSFYQVNHAQAERLYDYVLSVAKLSKTDTAVELYCGAGTITLALARAARFVYGIEVVPAAVLNAKENAVRNGVSNVEFILGDAGEAASAPVLNGITPAAVVVDPPRKGLSPDVIDAVSGMSPERIIYVSCDPATLARDVKLFSAKGFGVTAARAFDMFPRCAHVETVVKLEKL